MKMYLLLSVFIFLPQCIMGSECPGYEDFKDSTSSRLDEYDRRIKSLSLVSMTTTNLMRQLKVENNQKLQEFSQSVNESLGKIKQENPKPHLQEVACIDPPKDPFPRITNPKNIRSTLRKLLSIVFDNIFCEEDSIKRFYEMADRFSARGVDPDHVNTIADEYKAEQQYLKAMIMYFIEGKMYNRPYLSTLTPIHNAIADIADTFDEVVDKNKDQYLATKYVFLLITEMEKDYDRAMLITRSGSLISIIAKSYSFIGSIYLHFNDYQNYARTNMRIVQILKEQYGDDAATYSTYNLALNQLCYVYSLMNMNREAVEKCSEALAAHRKTTDWTSDSVKASRLSLILSNLKHVRSKV